VRLNYRLIIKLKDIQFPYCIDWYEHHVLMSKEIINNEGRLKKPIVISKDYKIIDGNHRYCVLLEEFGEEFDTEVIKIPINKKIYDVILHILIPLLFIFGLILAVTKKKDE